MRKKPLIPSRNVLQFWLATGKKGDYCIMDSPVLVILGSSVLKVGLWFAGNIPHMVFQAGCRESLGNVITAASSNILALFASHTQERLRLWAVAIVFWSTKVLMWKIWGGSGALWLYLSGAMVCGVVITCDDFVCRRSRVHPVGGPLRSLPAPTVIPSDSLCLNLFTRRQCNFILLYRKENAFFPLCHTEMQSPPLILTLNLRWPHNHIQSEIPCKLSRWRTSSRFQRVINLSTMWFYTDEG